MFEAAELGHTIDAATYDRRVPKLRAALLDAQERLVASAPAAVVIVVAGIDAAGKGETVNLLNEWMDPRYMATWGIGAPTEGDYPPQHRYWKALPPKGRIGVFFGSWHDWPIRDRVRRVIDQRTLDQRLEETIRFERMLTDEGVVLVKLWFHLSKKEQKKRLRELERDKRTRWRVTAADWKHFAEYDRFRRVAEHAVRRTSTGNAAWTLVEGADRRYRNVAVATALLEALQTCLDAKVPRRPTAAPPIKAPVDGKTLLAAFDASTKKPDRHYGDELERLQGRLALLTRDPRFAEIGSVVVFEGPDASGKGGAIRRLTAALDARHYRVVPIASPSEDERAQPYLWRFWRHVPRLGHHTLFDRSWYGRVLVERVEGLCAEADWMRAYGEIDDFEEQLGAHGVVVTKLWLQIDEKEQLRRFKGRERTKFKQYKLTADDWRNRAKWGAYQTAASEMIERTSVERAPWTIVPANDKHHARLVVLRTVCDRLESALSKHG